jgi:hypothetical protein
MTLCAKSRLFIRHYEGDLKQKLITNGAAFVVVQLPSSVSIVSEYRLGDQGSIPGRRKLCFL